MGFRDIGDFQRKSGDLAGAVRSYTKSKDYCTTSNHVLDMCLCVIDVRRASIPDRNMAASLTDMSVDRLLWINLLTLLYAVMSSKPSPL